MRRRDNFRKHCQIITWKLNISMGIDSGTNPFTTKEILQSVRRHKNWRKSNMRLSQQNSNNFLFQLLAFIFLMTATTLQVSCNSYAYIPYNDFQPHQQRRPHENFFHQPSIHFPRNLRKHPQWSEFWDAYNYQGPLEEDQARLPGVFERDYTKTVGYHPQKPSYYPRVYPQEPPNYPRVYPQEPPVKNWNVRDNDYNRYRDYFFKRFGQDFHRNEPRY